MKTSKFLKVSVLSALFALSTAAFAQPLHFDQKVASKTECSGALAQALEAAGKTRHSPNGVPELSVNSAGTAAVVIVCGLLVLAGRRRKGGEANA
ncbi:MAG: hypothetical protein ABI771_08135 [Betaproteobacteria bacterium]